MYLGINSRVRIAPSFVDSGTTTFIPFSNGDSPRDRSLVGPGPTIDEVPPVRTPFILDAGHVSDGGIRRCVSLAGSGALHGADRVAGGGGRRRGDPPGASLRFVATWRDIHRSISLRRAVIVVLKRGLVDFLFLLFFFKKKGARGVKTKSAVY